MLRKLSLFLVSAMLFACGDSATGGTSGGDSSSSENSNNGNSSSGNSGDVDFGSYLALPGNADKSAITSRYNSWITHYYVTYEEDFENGVFSEASAKEEAQGSARIKWSPTNETVSEGIGYGMLLASLNGDFGRFDKLWKYHKAYRIDGTALMAWHVVSFKRSSDGGSATDADIDVLAALLIAHKKTGNQDYLSDAIAIGASIWDTELSENKVLLPAMTRESLGDGTKFNISYMSLAALKMLSIYDSSRDWNSVLEANINYMQKVQNAGDGLFPDWSDADGVPRDPGNNSCSKITDSDGKVYEKASGGSCLVYEKESVRIPWRVAWYYHWFGDSRAKEMLNKMFALVFNETGGDRAQIKNWYGYNNGKVGNGKGGKQYWASLCATGLSDSENSSWNEQCNSFFILQSVGSGAYYPESLYLLYFMLFNGGFEL